MKTGMADPGGWRGIRVTAALALILVAARTDARDVAAQAPPTSAQAPAATSSATDAVVLDRAQGRKPLEEVITPLPPRLPYWPSTRETIDSMRRELATPRGHRFLKDLVPSQSGVVLLSVLVTLVTVVDWRRLRSSRHAVIALLQVLPVTFYGAVWFFGKMHIPWYGGLMDWAFTASMAISVAILGLLVWRGWRPLDGPWEPPTHAAALKATCCLLLLANLLAIAVREPDDSSFFVNLGAQRLRERHELPYGDPLLTGTPGAAYGPVLYVAQAAVQAVVTPQSTNADSPDRPILGEHSRYLEPPALASRVLLVAGHLLGVWLLWRLLNRETGRPEVAWAAAAAYCGSPLVMGIGGGPLDDQVCGVTFVSHVVPPALVLLSLHAIDSPAWSGAWLGLAAGAGFYPVMLVPAWCGYYWKTPARLARFLLALALVGSGIGALVLLDSRPADGLGLVATFVRDTLGHHTDPAGYGRSAFGFWGQRGGWRSWCRVPLLGGQALTSPMTLAWVVLAAGAGLIARGRTRAQLSLLAAAVALGGTLVKIHATGTYGMWWLALALYGTTAFASEPPVPGQGPQPSGRQITPSDLSASISASDIPSSPP